MAYGTFRKQTSTCVECGREVANCNTIFWSGKAYGKGCFTKHIKPMLLAKKLDDSSLYSEMNKLIISIIPSMECDTNNYFTNSIKFQSEKGYVSRKQVKSLLANVTFENRVKALDTIISILDGHEMYVREVSQLFLEFLLTDREKLIRKEERSKYREEHGTTKGFDKSFYVIKEREAMTLIGELHKTSESLQKFINASCGKGGLTEFCLDLGIFKEYEEVLESKLDKIYG